MASSDERMVGRYAMRGQIAAGGMATVHLGKLLGPAGFSRVVAIKALHAQFAKDPDFLAMFLDEARLAGRIRHPNVVPILDVVVRDGELFLVMEYVPGEALGRLVRLSREAGVAIPLPIALSIVVGALEGLHAAHEALDEQGRALGIVHRDVSPQNMLVGVDGVTRILDFGVAKAVGRMQVTRGEQLKGKIAYMAPEQLSRQPIDRGVDIYAASIVLWELLTEQRLFQAEDEVSTLQLALEGNVPRLGALKPELPPILDELVARGLARQRRERFVTAQELARALEGTGLLAPAHAVGAWVEHVARAQLESRAQQLSQAETGHVSATSRGLDDAQAALEASMLRKIDGRILADAATDVGPAAPAQALPTPRRRLLRAASVASVVSLALAAALHFAAPLAEVPEPRPSVKPASSGVLLLAPASVAVPTASSSQNEPPAAQASQRPAATGAATTRLHAPQRRSKLSVSSEKPKLQCDEPFTVDRQGVRIPKRECL